MANILYTLSGAATLWAIYDSGGMVLAIIPVLIVVALIAFHMGGFK